nr:Zgc:136513 protein [Danio rerio]
MAHRNNTQTDVKHNHSVSFTDMPSETDKNYISVFKRKSPLTLSPKRKYAVAVVSPLQKHDSCETGQSDVLFTFGSHCRWSIWINIRCSCSQIA